MAIQLNGSGPNTFSHELSFPNIGRRNLIINGDMRIAQRGTSFSGSAGYTLDRWVLGSSQSMTVSQIDTTLPNGRTAKALRCEYTAAVSAWCDMYQCIEDARLLDGQVITMSAWARTNMSDIRFRQWSTNSYGDPVPNDGAWHYVTVTITANTSAGAIKDTNGSTFGLTGSGAASRAIGDYLEFTEFQLELGSVATPFEHRSYGEELALCQRYYQYFDQNELSFTFDYASNPAVGNSYMSRRYTSLMNVMRASPSVIVTSLNHGLTGSPLVYGTPKVLCVSTHAGGYNNGNNPYVYISCTLDAEL